MCKRMLNWNKNEMYHGLMLLSRSKNPWATWSFPPSAAQNLMNILQTRDGLSAQSQSSPVGGPVGCSYNSHGSSMQESPSEREPQTHTRHLSLLTPLKVGFAAVTFCVSLSALLVATADYLSTLSMSSTSLGSDSELTGMDGTLWGSAGELRRADSKGTLFKVCPPEFPTA